MTVNADPMPVSVFVSPRLEGAAALGAFADWVTWTQHLNDGGLELEFSCGGQSLVVPIDRGPLRPELWAELFKADTLVRSHTFDDYTDRGVISYSVRQALSALKAIYQQASVELALPDAGGGQSRRDGGNRELLSRLVSGLEVHWNGRDARAWRDAVRLSKHSLDVRAATFTNAGSVAAMRGPLDSEGLIAATPSSSELTGVAVPFSVFHHMPTPKRTDVPLTIDPDTVLDFHQALTALNSYPDLLRALGLVLDIDLPREFVAETPPGQVRTISIATVSAGWEWALGPLTPPLETAYIHTAIGPERYFFTAPRILVDPGAPSTVLGLLDLDPERFGLAQVDADGAMHKAIMLAETYSPPPGHNLKNSAGPEAAPHPEVFDPEATLPSLRSGGVSLFADRRALELLESLVQSKAFNDAIAAGGAQPRPFCAEDLVRGYRLDVWDSRTDTWHSLHQRNAESTVGKLPFEPATSPEEGFVQLAATQPAPGAEPSTNDLYLHEAIARWAGWSLSAPMPAKHLTRHPDAARAIPTGMTDPDEYQPITPFKVAARYKVAPGTLPRMRFGTRYRLRARAVDLAGSSLELGALADQLSAEFALPADPEGFAFLRYEPVPAPLVILHDPRGVTAPGSAVERIVLRTFNTAGRDLTPADATAAERHIVPPRASVELGQRLGMFDDAGGKLKADPATWKLIVDRDLGELPHVPIEVAGKKTDNDYPVVAAATLDPLPFLPDLLARGAAIRDLPGTPDGALGKAVPDTGTPGQIDYAALSDPNPRPGSATLISFDGSGDWEKIHGFRLALAEPAPGQTDLRPRWDPTARVLTVQLPKGHRATVPLTSFTTVDDLKLMGVWQWLREYIETVTVTDPRPQILGGRSDADQIAHVLQRAVEGGHWMLTPPRLITLVHAVQQPLGRPEFAALGVYHDDALGDPTVETAPDRGPTDPGELAPVTAWRRLGATETFLTGALKVHGASTAKVDLLATWTDPTDSTDDLIPPGTTIHRASIEEVPLERLSEGYLYAAGKNPRAVGYYDPEHDQIAFTRKGDRAGPGRPELGAVAPRHVLGDVKRHVVTYTAMATSRYRDYFDPNQVGGFERPSEPVVVDVPASQRPLAPDVGYVIPTFGWQRQVETNLKRASASAVACASTCTVRGSHPDRGNCWGWRSGAIGTARSTRLSARSTSPSSPSGAWTRSGTPAACRARPGPGASPTLPSVTRASRSRSTRREPLQASRVGWTSWASSRSSIRGASSGSQTSRSTRSPRPTCRSCAWLSCAISRTRSRTPRSPGLSWPTSLS